MVKVEIDLMADDSKNKSRYGNTTQQDCDIEDIIDDPVKFHQKLLETGVIDEDYFDFLNELEESGKYEITNVQQVEKYYTSEIDNLKTYYENQIQSIKEEGSQTIESLHEENITLTEK
jgi:hypothetical protein